MIEGDLYLPVCVCVCVPWASTGMGKGGTCPPLEKFKSVTRGKNSISEVSLNGRHAAFP